jgi:8-oxo-dGTP diphosphatase
MRIAARAGRIGVLLLRHASAGERLSSPSLDRARTLDRAGRRDARMLPDALAGHALERIVSSPHVRCIETVSPVARALGLEVECREELAPDASRSDALALLAELPDEALVCTHREVIERVFGGEVTSEKGGTWLLERRRRARRWRPAAYLPPPSSRAKGARRRTTLV